MADYIYLLENRLSVPQKTALNAVRAAAMAKGLTLFLVGAPVRDLTSGSPVRELEFVVQGEAGSLEVDLRAAGLQVTRGEDGLSVLGPGGLRAEVGSTRSATYPKPNQPVFTPAPIGEDLRRRDFTANAMALSLNGGSYGLLLDPLNGVADIENRELRLVSNYGFLEEPVRLIRATRLMARLGWTLEEKTQGRYDTASDEGYLDALTPHQRGLELEEIARDEDPLRVLRRLEEAGWMKVLAPTWTLAKANEAELERLRETQMQLQMQGITADAGAAAFPLLTAKMTEKERVALRTAFPHADFVREIESLESEAREFATQLTSKAAASNSASWKLIHATRPEVLLQAFFSARTPAVQNKFRLFTTEWPQSRQRIPYSLLQEMRIGPELPGYAELMETLLYELMDGRLDTEEAMRAFLQPFSPPAPPPPVSVKRTRASKKSAKNAVSRAKKEQPEMDGLAEEPVDENPESEPELAQGERGSEESEITEEPEPEFLEDDAEPPVSVPVDVEAAAEDEPEPGPEAVAVEEEDERSKPAPRKQPRKTAAKKAAAPVRKASRPAIRPAPAKGKPALPGTKAAATASRKAAKVPAAAAPSDRKAGSKPGAKAAARKTGKAAAAGRAASPGKKTVAAKVASTGRKIVSSQAKRGGSATTKAASKGKAPVTAGKKTGKPARKR